MEYLNEAYVLMMNDAVKTAAFSSVVTAFGTVALFLVTFGLLVATVILALESRSLRLSQSFPGLYASIQPYGKKKKYYAFVVHNYTLNPAYEVEVRFEKDLACFPKKNGSNLGSISDFFKNKISVIPSRFEYKIPFGYLSDQYNDAAHVVLDDKFFVEIFWKDKNGKSFDIKQCVDLSLMSNNYVGESHSIEKEKFFREVQKDIRNIYNYVKNKNSTPPS